MSSPAILCPQAPRDPDDRLMTTGQVADLLAVPESTLRDWRHRLPADNPGPPSLRIGPRAVRYWRSDVLAWIDEQQTRHRDE